MNYRVVNSPTTRAFELTYLPPATIPLKLGIKTRNAILLGSRTDEITRAERALFMPLQGATDLFERTP